MDFEPFPLEKNMVDELLCGRTLQTKVIIIHFPYHIARLDLFIAQLGLNN